MSDEATAPASRVSRTFTWWAGTLAVQGVILCFTFFRLVEGYVTLFPVDAWALAAVALTIASVFLRTSKPWAFLAVVVPVNLAYTIDTPAPYPGLGLLAALPFAAYAVCSVVPMRIAVATAAGVDVILIVTALVARGTTLLNVFPVGVTAALAVALAAGQVTYTRRRLLNATQRRAEEAERTREALAAARVAEHRLDTARELHDVVGHQVAVINLQAGAASRAVFEDPRGALASLAVIEASAGRILAEIGELLKELRNSPGDEPVRSVRIEGLHHLIDTLEAGGLPLEVRIDADLPTLAPGVDEAVYRILEEAMVNAYKHGEANRPAQVTVSSDAKGLLIRVSNPVGVGQNDRASTGLGLLGIRERAAALGGTATVSVEHGEFELTVRIPVEAR
ncbi:hypothetical protein GCM10009819_07220 [Agromyces tropicus]|uniref:histidine kinase n=1 Tax=Agromyces tropicus TaxID=555371 RepID=A0ABP5FH56_9MICO